MKDDSFVPVKKMSSSQLETPVGEGEATLKDKLLELPGVMISDAESRVYPYGECTSHLLGYVQEINAEELEELRDKGYDEQSILGKSGLEKLFENRLKDFHCGRRGQRKGGTCHGSPEGRGEYYPDH